MVAAHLNEITLCMAYYENPSMLAKQYLELSMLPATLKKQIRLIVVDDGSPEFPIVSPGDECLKRMGLASVALYRMDVDVRWNQDACRNLAVSQAETKWVLLTDIDHIVPVATWRRIIFGRLSWKATYSFERETGPTLSVRNPHPNSWLLRVETFDAMGGYDERFAGYYGTDGDFRRRLEDICKVERLPEKIHEVTPDMVVDCRTTTYERKTPEDRANIPKIARERGSARPLRGRFPWHRVA